MPTSIVPGREPSPPVAVSPCASCSAPLAADQLFCLACGARRRDARIAFRDVLATEAAPVAMAPAGAAAPGPAYGPAAAAPLAPSVILGGAVSLLLALGLGVWIGRGQGGGTASAATPVALPAALAATTPASTTPADEAADSGGSSAGDAGDGSGDAETGPDEATAPAPSEAVKSLENLSPKDYQKQSQKLPKTVGTGGTAPPKDDKPAGGGTGFEEIK